MERREKQLIHLMVNIENISLYQDKLLLQSRLKIYIKRSKTCRMRIVNSKYLNTIIEHTSY